MVVETVLMRTKGRFENVEIVQLSPLFNLVRKEVTPKGRGRKTYWTGRIVRLPRWEHVLTLSSFTREGIMRAVAEYLGRITPPAEDTP